MNAFENTLEFALELDQKDQLFAFRERFFIPEHNDKACIYLCGNSLGLQPKSTKYLIEQELKDWAKYGVEGHFNAANPWFSYHEYFSKPLAKLVGANEDEVIAANTLTVNLHLLMVSFYRPTGKRTKIIMEAGAFPSDQYAMETQVKMHGLIPEEHIIELTPRDGEKLLREEDILEAIKECGDELAVVMMGGVNYYTGQYYPLEKITKAAHEVGAMCGFDLAHAVGNVPLSLHDWDVDFACWCSYKYLNGGPGGVGGYFVHKKWLENKDLIRLAGWWGNDPKTRFSMTKGFVPAETAGSWQMSNAQVFNMIGLRASLDIFEKTSYSALREKSELLTGFLEFLLLDSNIPGLEIITPSDPKQRGCQLSLVFSQDGKKIFKSLTEQGVIADWREPDVIRVAPVPLYNTFEDVYKFVQIIKETTN